RFHGVCNGGAFGPLVLSGWFVAQRSGQSHRGAREQSPQRGAPQGKPSSAPASSPSGLLEVFLIRQRWNAAAHIGAACFRLQSGGQGFAELERARKALVGLFGKRAREH